MNHDILYKLEFSLDLISHFQVSKNTALIPLYIILLVYQSSLYTTTVWTILPILPVHIFLISLLHLNLNLRFSITQKYIFLWAAKAI